MAVRDNVDDFLTAAQDLSALWPEQDMGYFLRDPANMMDVCRMVDSGFNLPNVGVEHILMLAKQVSTLDAAATYWAAQGQDHLFGQDDLYTDTRFQLITSFRSERSGLHSYHFPALRQLRRMCEAGLANPRRMEGILSLNPVDPRFQGEDEFLLAVWPAQLTRLENHLTRTRTVKARLGTTSPGPNGFQDEITKLTAKLAVGWRLRDEFFTQRWLKAAISSTEWAEVQDLGVEMLRELYPQVWADGYAGYRRLVARKTVTHA